MTSLLKVNIVIIWVNILMSLVIESVFHPHRFTQQLYSIDNEIYGYNLVQVPSKKCRFLMKLWCSHHEYFDCDRFVGYHYWIFLYSHTILTQTMTHPVACSSHFQWWQVDRFFSFWSLWETFPWKVLKSGPSLVPIATWSLFCK